MSIQAVCRVCNSKAPADQFKLHHTYRQMVCPTCFTGKNKVKKEVKKEQKSETKPPGWDQEDEYLERVAKLRKEENQSQFSQIPGTDYVRCKCMACKYSFRYNPFKKSPQACPYCNAEIPKLKTFNLL